MTRTGRPVGTGNISMKQIEKIIELTMQGQSDLSITRPFIASVVGVSEMTVYRIQKQFDLI